MIDAPIISSCVSDRGGFDLDDATEAVDTLVGQTIRAGTAQLVIGRRIADGIAGSACFTGRLRTGSTLLPSVAVDIVVSPWSTTRTEISVRPLGRLGRPGSLRHSRFFAAAWPVLDALIGTVAQSATARQATPVLQVAA